MRAVQPYVDGTITEIGIDDNDYAYVDGSKQTEIQAVLAGEKPQPGPAES